MFMRIDVYSLGLVLRLIPMLPSCDAGACSLKGQAPLSRRAAPARVKGVAARSSPEERSSVGRGSALERV